MVFLTKIKEHACLLTNLRVDLNAISEVQSNELGQEKKLDVGRLKNECPLLNSTFNEVRLHASSLSSRIVTENTISKSNILLKKGSIINMPSAILHSNKHYWGIGADFFDSRRFLDRKFSGALRKEEALAFRPFAIGGGSTLCPGRHFGLRRPQEH
ncbi:hypothetical protein LSUE1_G000919 [Lachnellula suecica]|uniref:Cytochrome P450 n=1 Tax=Lachnellula suecica TaxID=602035 RepID=A0A8T9CIK4_9HELO|nr:hypothetical protein LSUE1_G000919 [Lachnellula suecica]